MSHRVRLFVGACALVAGCAGAAASQHEQSTVTSELPADTLLDDDAGVHFHQEAIADYTVGGTPPEDGGAGEQVFTPHHTDAGAIAVSADGGVASGELAWLVTHIADTPDRLRSDDSDNVRQIAAHGADGVRAISQVFARGDALRTPFARRVVERTIMRRCGRRDRSDAQALGAWMELGDDMPATAPDGLMHWTRPADSPWPPDAVQRLLTWVDAGMPCTMPRDGSPAPAASGSPAPPRSGTDAGTHRP